LSEQAARRLLRQTLFLVIIAQEGKGVNLHDRWVHAFLKVAKGLKKTTFLGKL